MTQHSQMLQASYDPNRLLDTLMSRMNLKSDAALARALDVAPAMISKIRHKHSPIGAWLLIEIHELTGIGIRELRDLMGDRRLKYRFSIAEQKAIAGQSTPAGNHALQNLRPIQPTSETSAEAMRE
jgi:hypothetical protein